VSIVDSVVLGLVQGLTEFLPISSSGHLVFLRALLGFEGQGIAFEVFVHFGTGLAIITVFWGQICRLVAAAFRGIIGPGDISSKLKEDEHTRLVALIVIGSVPAAILGISLEDKIEQAFLNPPLVAVMLLLTGVVLWPTRYVKSAGRRVNYKDSILIGIAQAIAIIPGISRSGLTIAAGLYRNVDRSRAAEFSFLLALPAILGATFLNARKLLSNSSPTAVLPLVVGTVVAYVSGYVAIRLLLGIVRRGRLDRFSYYCWVIGLTGLVLTR